MPKLKFRQSHKRRLKELEDRKQPKGVYAAGSHTHAQSDITNLTTDLAGKAAIASANAFTATQSIDVTDATVPALRVTQRGAGPSLLVEDSGNPDATPLIVDGTGNVGIGHLTPLARLHIQGSTDTGGIFVEDSSTSNSSPVIRAQGKRSDNNAFPSFTGRFIAERLNTSASLGNGVTLGGMVFGGNYDAGGSLAYPASIVARTDAAWTASSNAAARLEFFTGSTGQTDLDTANVNYGTERVRINKDGAVGFAGANFGTAGQYLRSGGGATTPAWTSIPQSEVTDLVTDLSNKQPLATVLTNTTAAFTTAQETKLAGIETAADVTDATNVAAAGAVMTSDIGTTVQAPYTHVSKTTGATTTAADTTPVNVTGAVFTYAANSTYRIWMMGRVNAAEATTGIGLRFDLSSAVTAIDTQFFYQLADAGTLAGGHSIADAALVDRSTPTFFVPASAIDVPVTMFGLLVTGANTGTAQLQLQSGAMAAVELSAGAVLIIEKVM